MQKMVSAFQERRDIVVARLNAIPGVRCQKPLGAFYVFPKAPWGTGSDFVAEAIRNNLLIIPGNVFSRKDSHFRLSYAAADATIERGIDILKRLAQRREGRGANPWSEGS